MTLIQQFPEISMQVRRLNQKKTRRKIVSPTERIDSGGKELDLYYDNEFRKWHNKLAVIIAFITTCLLVALVGIARLF